MECLLDKLNEGEKMKGFAMIVLTKILKLEELDLGKKIYKKILEN